MFFFLHDPISIRVAIQWVMRVTTSIDKVNPHGWRPAGYETKKGGRNRPPFFHEP